MSGHGTKFSCKMEAAVIAPKGDLELGQLLPSQQRWRFRGRLRERLLPGCLSQRKSRLWWIVRRVDRELALEKDACKQILRECGFLRGGSNT
jgi:hypothetical protein